MNECKYCLKKRAGLNEKGYCAPCEALELSYLKSRLNGRDIDTIRFVNTVQDLKEYAAILNIKGRSKLNKSQLVEAVYNAFNEFLAAENMSDVEKAYNELPYEAQQQIDNVLNDDNKELKEVGIDYLIEDVNWTIERMYLDISEGQNKKECLEIIAACNKWIKKHAAAANNKEELNVNEIGYCIVNYHTGSELSSAELGPLFSELQQLEKEENAAGFYKVLKVDTCIFKDGSRHYFKSNPIQEFEVKTAAEIKDILIQFNAATINNYVCEECKKETTDFENIGDSIFCNDCINKVSEPAKNEHAAAAAPELIEDEAAAAPAELQQQPELMENKLVFYSFKDAAGKEEIFAYIPAKNESELYFSSNAEKALLKEAAAAGRYDTTLNTMKLIGIFKNATAAGSDLLKAAIGREYYYNTFENEENDYIASCFNEIKEINNKLFKLIPFPVIFTDRDEYSSAAEMRRRVIDEKVIYIYKGFSGHPYLSEKENCIGRAVHDVFAHLVCGCPFDFQGEYSAFIEQIKYYPKHLHSVLFAEIPAQTAAYYYKNNFNFNQRAFSAPDRWQQLLKGFEKDYSKNSIMQPFKELQFN